MAIEKTDLGVTPVTGGEEGGEGGERHKFSKRGTGEKIGCQEGVLSLGGVWGGVSVGHGCAEEDEDDDWVVI